MATELEVKSLKGAATIAAIGAVAVLLIVVAAWGIPKIRAKVGV
jgi:hypothetical protein